MILLSLLLGYLIGSIPFALLLPRHAAGVDIRRAGSGNLGAANVLRTAGLPLAVGVMALDLAKGASAAFVAGQLAGDLRVTVAAGLASILGHVFPVWLRFRGGKGVATTCGVFAVLAPIATMISVAVFVATTWVTRYVSVGSVVASLALGPTAYMIDVAPPVVIGAIAAGALIVYRHRDNLSRLMAGTERQLARSASLK